MKKCGRCYRAGDDIGHCGSHTTGCPPAKTVDPIRDVVLSCEQCGILRAIPVERIMQGKIKALTGRCKTDRCKAVIVRPAAPLKAQADGSKSKA